MKKLSLSEAVRGGRLEEFAKQEELRGVGPVGEGELHSMLSKVIKAPRSKRQTSRSASRGGSAEK